MGITITATNPKYEFDMGYFGFFKLRREIALALNEEFDHLDRYADVLDFLYTPDSAGEVGYKTCGNILSLIQNRKSDINFRYSLMQHNDWEEFKEFLQDCYSHHKKMRWR